MFQQNRLQHMRKLQQSFAWSSPHLQGLLLVFVCVETTEYKAMAPSLDISYPFCSVIFTAFRSPINLASGFCDRWVTGGLP